MPQSLIEPTAARRLTDVLRLASTHSQRFEHKGPVAESEATLQLVVAGGVMRQRFLADGRQHTVAVYYGDDVINLMGYIAAPRTNTDYLLALKGTVIGSVSDAAVAGIRSRRHLESMALACWFTANLELRRSA
jgi:hypothetical protein